jgi:hypothetical protein
VLQQLAPLFYHSPLKNDGSTFILDSFLQTQKHLFANDVLIGTQAIVHKTPLPNLRMHHIKLPFFTLLFCCLFISAEAQQSNDWVFKNEKGGVKVYYRKTSDVYELKLVTSIKSTASGLIKLLSEVEHYPEWGYKVASNLPNI